MARNNSSGSKPDRTATRFFRISGRALDSIEEEAKRRNVSVSIIINQQLLAHADFERYFRRLGLIKISLATFQRLLKAGSDDHVARAGKEAGMDSARSVILAKYGSLSLDTAIDYLRMLSEYANLFEIGQVDSGGRQIVSLLHNLGPKGSLFFRNYVNALFQSIEFDPKITYTEHSIVIEIVLQDSRTSSF